MKRTGTKDVKEKPNPTRESLVLIVDDDPTARDLIRVTLSREGHHLVYAANGSQALAKARELTPDLILLDVMMPDINGFEVCRRLRTDPLLGQVPIVMITALTDRDARLQGIEAGADDFISKPLDPAELRARVRTITRLNRYRLLRERAVFEQLVKVLPDGLVITDAEGVVQLVNPTMLRMLAVDEEGDVVGKELLTFVAPQGSAALSTCIRDVVAAAPEATQAETWFIRSDGERFAAEINARHLTWQEEPAAQIIVRDATERKLAEEKLHAYAQQQTALYTIASTVAASSLKPDELLADALDVVLNVLDADAGWVVLPGSTEETPSRVVASRAVPASLLADGTPPTSDKLAQAGLREHVSIPLSAGDGVLGVMEIAWRQPYSCTEADLSLLTAISQQLGLALRNAQLYQSALQVDRLQVLNELDQALVATLDPQEVAHIALHRIAEALDAPTGTLLLIPPHPNAGVEIFTVNGERIEAPPCDDLPRRLRDSREALLLSGDKLSQIAFSCELVEQWGSSALVIPVRDEDDLVALLALGGRPDSRPFTDEERALAQAVASRARQAIQNARLYQTSRQTSARLTTLNTISAAATSSLELDVVLRQILELTCQALDATAGSILVTEPETEDLILVLTRTDEMSSLRGHRLAAGQGIAGWVVQHGQSVCVNDVHSDPRWHSDLDAITGIETRNLCCAPMKHRQKITGAIELINKREGRFSEDDLSLLEAVSSIAAAALENARLYATTRARANELALLNEIGLALTATLDFSTVVHAALNQAQRLLQAENISLLQPDSQTGELRFIHALIKGVPTEIPVRLPRGEGIAAWVLEQRQPVLLADAQKDPRFLDWVYEHIGSQIRALMAVPLLSRGRAIGVIEVAGSEPGIYTREELYTLQALASTVAVALENASLYDELRALLRDWEEAQAQLIHTEKMAAVGRLAASIAHEINNPLQAVQTYLTMTQEELSGEGRRDQLTRYLDTVESEIERISAIVRRMREFYRPARQGMRPTYVHDVLESVLELTKKQLQHSDVRVERAWADCLPEIQANPDHLKQVFLNLVLNAIEALPEGGTLCISTSMDQIHTGDDQQAHPAVRIEFSDTGEGMPPETLSHLFEPFFTTKESGTGLGLSTSYGIIRSHNGQMTVQSHVGLGTTFTILLPVTQPPAIEH